MLKFDYENWLPCDVDETLITRIDPSNRNGGFMTIEYGGDLQFFDSCTDNVALLKHHKTVRGYGIIVWSANGKEWAEKIVKRLKLEEYVDIVMTKPSKYLDDKPVQEWMPSQIHLGVE